MENVNPSSILVILNLVVLVGGIIGGYLVLRTSLAHGSQEIQERVRVALKDENEGLQRRLDALEDDYAMCKRQLELVVEIMRRQGIILEINGEMVKVRDAQGATFGRSGTPAPKRPRPPPNKPKGNA